MLRPRKHLLAPLFLRLPFSMQAGVTRLVVVMAQQQMLWLPVAFGLGALFYLQSPVEPPFKPLLGCFFAFLVPLLALARREAETITDLACHLLVLVLLWVMAGAIYCQAHVSATATPVLSRDLGWRDVQGRIVQIDPLPAAETRLTLDRVVIEDLPSYQTPHRLRVTLKKPGDILFLPNQVIQVTAQISAPSLPATIGAYDFQRHNFLQQIGGMGFAVKPPVIVTEAAEGGLQARLSALRAHLQTQVERALPTAQAGIATALLTGAQTGITEDLLQDYRASGLAHALSVSGMHIGMIAGAVFFITRLGLVVLVPRAGLFWPVKKIAALTGLFAALGYTLLVGPLLPAWRSMIMTALILLAIVLDRLAISLRTLALAAMVLLLLYPEAVVNIGFQLSFLAVFALVALYGRLRDIWPEIGAEWPAIIRQPLLWLGGTVLTGLIATIATAPLILYHFQQLPLYGALANALATPLLSFVTMPLVVVVLATYPFGLADVPLRLLGRSVEWLNTLAASVADLPDAVWLVPAGSGVAIIALLLSVIIASLARGAIGATLAIVCLSASIMLWTPQHRAVMYAYPSGDIALIKLADGQWLRTTRYSDFIIEQWLKREGTTLETAVKIPSSNSRKKTEPEKAALPVTCDRAACRIVAADGLKVSLIKQTHVAAEECLWADIVLSKNNLGRNCPDKQLDRFRLEHEGAAIVTRSHEGGFHITTQRMSEPEQRPWRRYSRGNQ